jgi:Fe-S-cluster-containing dehydrogenase component
MFLGGMAATGAACFVPLKDVQAAARTDSYATLIDLTRCDGCPNREMPACVAACRTANADRFPEPDPAMLKDYWPQPKHEDWSDKQHVFDRLTPYNWLFVQHVTVEIDNEEVEVSVPRRCMHCDNPPCVKLCPFGSNRKTAEGPVYIDETTCLGGAKCRDVCPWHIPQRQAGVGIYTQIDPLPAGGGVMYKCDLCRDRLAEGGTPACIEECPNNAMHIGTREEIAALAEQLRDEYDGYIYGDTQNGGTSTLYVSAVPFEAIDAALAARAEDPTKVMRMHDAENMLQQHIDWGKLALAAPLVGVVGALVASRPGRTKKPVGGAAESAAESAAENATMDETAEAGATVVSTKEAEAAETAEAKEENHAGHADYAEQAEQAEQ